MATNGTPGNRFITNKAPDTTLSVQLHPLVLLTISDYITRHISRQQEGPIVGAIIGEQNGTTVTLESAYELKINRAKSNDLEIDQGFFGTRLEQYKDVYKVPPLDFVGVFMLGPTTGPHELHVEVAKQVQVMTSNDTSLLLLFHPEMVNDLQGGKLPVTLYESVSEHVGSDWNLRFREVPFEVETNEAERIGVDFVAQGGGNATMVSKADVGSGSSTTATTETAPKDKKGKGKGKGKVKEQDVAEVEASLTNILSPEDEEIIASLTAKVNAIKMLSQRIELIRLYLTSLSPSYLTDPTSEQEPNGETNYPLLRSIKALVSRLPLLTPPTSGVSLQDLQSGALSPAAEREKQDVHLTSLLANLTRAVSEAQSMGSKFNIVQRDKLSKERGALGQRGAARPTLDEDAFISSEAAGL